jgi:enoyl-CoA hydratase
MGDNVVSIERQGDIAVVHFNRGGRANALSFAIMDMLGEAALSFETDARVAAVVLSGAASIFSAGMDLADEAFDRLTAMDLAERRMLAEHGPRLARAWASIEAPTIAAIEGPCLAGGLALAAMLDFRVAAQNARFAAPEIQVAHNMGWHSVPRLVALVGVQATRRLLMAGEEWSADMAHKLGFVDRVVAPGDALTSALAMAGRLAGYPHTAARMIKRQIAAAAHGNEFAVSALDKDQQLVAWMSEDFTAARARFKKTK